MSSDPTSRRHWLAVSAAIVATFCSAPVAWAQERTLRVGFQKGGGLLGLLKSRGTLERALAPNGWAVSWHEFPAGPQLLEALNAGSVDFGYTGAPPPIFAQAAGKDLVYVGAEPGSVAVESIVVKPGSPIRQVADLKGRRVAVQKGSSANFLLVAALENAGIAYGDIEPIYLPPADARAAFESDRVDAWSIWDPYLAAVQSALGARVVADYTGLLRTNSFYEASRRLTTEQPQLLARVLDEIATLGAWATAHPREVAEQLAPVVGLPVEVVETWQRRTRYGVQALDDKLVATQQTVADTFLKHKLIPKAIDVSSAVWRWPRG